MAHSNMVIFNDFVMPAIVELFPQAVNKFNAASNNTIQLQASNFTGDFLEQSFYQALYSAQRRVDRNAAIASQASTDLAQLQINDVKIAGGFGPVLFEPSQLTWLTKPTQEGITIAATAFVDALMADQLNTAIASLVAAIENVPAVTNDVSSGGTGTTVTQQEVNNGLALFGDRSQSLGALIMTGFQYHNLIGNAIDNSNSLFTVGGVAVMDGTAFGQGRPIVITDAPALTGVNTTPTEKVLALQTGAAIVKDGGDIITNIETTNGNTRIETTFQTDYTFGLGLKGYSWDIANGGSSPSDAELATGSNWDSVMTSEKDTAGVIIIGDAS
jgi:hypothetical protein